MSGHIGSIEACGSDADLLPIESARTASFRRRTLELNVDPIEEVSRRLQEATEHPFLVAIDGEGGAGKSTLAKELQRRHPHIALIQFDDFYRPKEEDRFWAMSARDGYEGYFDWQRLREQVLEPLSNGLEANYQIYDWPRNSLQELRRLICPGVAVVEGCFILRPELRGYFHLKIWVDAPSQVRFSEWQHRGVRGSRPAHGGRMKYQRGGP